jgi:TonB family protein
MSVLLKGTLGLVVCFTFSCFSLLAQDRVTAEKLPPGTPMPAETPSDGLMRAANQASQNRDYSTCAQLLEKVVSSDPNHKNAWNFLGWTYNMLGQFDKAEAALRKAIAINPQDPSAYNNLGQTLSREKKYDDAIPQYQKQIEINPKDRWAHANLGRVYLLNKQYDKAIPELELAATITPNDANIPFNLGIAYARNNQPDLALKALEKSVELQPVPSRWNDVAYEIVYEKLPLAQAEHYSQSAIAAIVLQMRDTSLEHLTREDTFKASRIAAYWDTWGWIRFQKNDLPEAEKYIKSAWMVFQHSTIGDHLGQIYEKEGRKSDAIHIYQMLVTSDSVPSEIRARLAKLAGPDANISKLTEEGRGLLKESNTLAVRNSHQAEGFAEFWILLSPGPAVLGVKFISGDDELALFAKDLEAVSYPNSFPEATELKLLRRARLSCTHSSPDCRLQMISSTNVPTNDLEVAASSVSGDMGRLRVGGTVQGAKIVKKVPPVYPDEARKARIDGLVRLHVIIAKDGTISQLELISGHPMLVQAAIDAVRQWVYQPTLLNGNPIEVDTVIDVYFRLNVPQQP